MATAKQISNWQLTGDTATSYEQYMVPAIFREGARLLVDHAGVQDGHRVLDLGCGTGIVARTAVSKVGHTGKIVGVDINPDMLNVARKVSENLEPDIEWQRGPAEDLPLARSSFDVVISQQAFQFFEDQGQALSEIRRVLAPRGRAVLGILRSVDHNRTYHGVIEAFRQHGGNDLAMMMQSPFQQWTVNGLREKFIAAGFSEVIVEIAVFKARFPSVPAFLEYELASSPLGEVVAELGQSVIDRMVLDVADDLQDYCDDLGVMHPLQTYVVTASG
jgi:ubiquinone/menaquinone biosynthesis C-methylase UbiE